MAGSRERRSAGSRRSSGGGGGKGRRSRRVPSRAQVVGWLKVVALVVCGAAFAAGFAVSVWVVRLDRIVTARFEGQRFAVPSRVYSAPTILYPGLDWKLMDLRSTFERLGYREARRSKGLPPGQYVWSRDRVRIHLPPFAHPSRPEPARDVVLRLRGDRIEEVRTLPSGREVGAVLLEPEQIGAYYGPDREQRELVRLPDVPEHLIDAILAVEDQRFLSHAGIDWKRIGGAMLANLKAGRIRQGGSTLTQQLVKNFFLTPERTFSRKAQEAVMALLVEARYDKERILEAYLNEIYMGQRGSTAVHGVGEAARLYFGKPVRELRVEESALLAAIIHSPNATSPYRGAERAVKRRNLVLDLMQRQGRLDDAAWEEARDAPLHLSRVTPDASDARFFLDFVRRQLAEGYDAEVLTSEGLRIYSTLDRRLQRLAAGALREGLESLEAAHPGLRREERSRALQGCIVALRPQTGQLLAMVGGRSYAVSQFDRCTQARRPTGSVFKPFVYIAALEPRRRGEGPVITLASRLDDGPLELETPTGVWRPENYDREFHGEVSAREALERSLNVATARLAQQVGIDRVIDVARRMGIQSPLPAVPSLALGTADLSPLEVARAYSTLASGGVRADVRGIEDVVDPHGRTLERERIDFQRVLDPGAAFLATSLLEGVATRGTAARLHSGGLRGPIAAKTGTSDGERDLWLVGFTPELVVVVWVGFDEPASLGIPSSVGALPIWRRFVNDVTGGRIRGRFVRPRGIQEAEIEPATGALALSGCSERQREFFLEGTLPEATCPVGAVARRPESDDDPGVRRRFFDWLRRNL